MNYPIASINKDRKHANAEWYTRPADDKPYQKVKAADDLIFISFMPGYKLHGYTMTVTRADARLLAKRINQCLDATVKK